MYACCTPAGRYVFVFYVCNVEINAKGNHPRARIPPQALVIEDAGGMLPATLGAVAGVVLRNSRAEFALDLELKLRIANGLHSAMAYPMALAGHRSTSDCRDVSSTSYYVL